MAESKKKKKKGKVIQGLYLRQKKMFRSACYGTAGLLTLFAILVFVHVGADWFLPIIILVYALLVFLNIVAFEAHRQIVPSWIVMQVLIYVFIIHIMFLTGGIQSGMSTFLVALSFVGYVYGRKMGRIEFAVSILIFLGFAVMYYFKLYDFPNLIPKDSMVIFNLYALVFSCVILGLFFGEMTARTTYHAFKDKQEIEHQHEVISEKNREIEILSVVANQSRMSMVVIDLVGRVIWMNEVVKQKYEKERQRIISHTGSDELEEDDILNDPMYFGEEEDMKRSYVTDRITVYDLSRNPDLRRHISRVIEKGKPLSYETQEPDEFGEEEWVLSTITPLFNEEGQIFQLSIVDTQITEQKHIESEIRAKSIELRKQRDEVAHHRHLAETHRDEILASITYAKKIQTAMLRYENRITQKAPRHFIIHEPKDIVSGDFYWMMQKNQYIYMAVADCTGHGVPGAMLAMLGAGYLNEICSINRALQPSFILDELRDKFMIDLEQDGSEFSRMDGMDISLIRYDFDTNKLEWAGANNPLVLIQDNELIHAKGNLQPIGYSEDATLFTNHEFEVKPGDGVYMFSDGYSDQFGGPYGRKFGNKKFRELLHSTHQLDMEAQKIRLLNDLENWRLETNEERTDDICVLGIRF